MAAMFFGMIALAGTVVAVAASLAVYAQRHWTTGRTEITDAGTVLSTRRSHFFRPLGDVAGFGEQLRDVPARYGYVEARRAG